MSQGDYEGQELMGMATRAADPYVPMYTKAVDVLKVLPQLAAADLQTCIAFRIDPFVYVHAKALEADNLAKERLDRVERERRRAQERLRQDGIGRQVIADEHRRFAMR